MVIQSDALEERSINAIYVPKINYLNFIVIEVAQMGLAPIVKSALASEQLSIRNESERRKGEETMRSQLTEIYNRVSGMVNDVKSLPPDEFDLFLDLLLPEPEQAPKPKKTRKKRQSKNKPGLAAAIHDSIARSHEAGKTSDPICGVCGNTEDYQDHFEPSPNYHVFVAPKKSGKAA